MTKPTTPALTDHERSVTEQANRLANTLAENQHETLIPELLAPWFKHAQPAVREGLRSSFKRGQATQLEVSKVLARLQPVEQFAEPLLKTALAARGWFDADPKAWGIKQVRLLSNLLLFFADHQLKLVDPLIHSALPEILIPESLELNLVASITEHSLLQAALQNFEPAEAVVGGFDPGSCTYKMVGNQPVEQPDFKMENFALICRDLNLGMQYQWHLAHVFEPADDQYSSDNVNSSAFKVQALFSENLHHEFMCALHMAYMKGEVTPVHYRFLILLLGSSISPLSRFALNCSTLQVTTFEVPGVIVFWPQRRLNNLLHPACLLYLPNSPNGQFHAFDSFDLLKATLGEWLKGRVFSQYFFKLIPLRHRAEFIRRTDIKNMTWDSLLLRRPPIISEPALMSETWHVPQAQDPFTVAWRLQLAKIKDDARVLVVPTEDEDSRSRLARQATFLNLGLSLLTLALGFVPVIGELLLVTSVIQLGVEVYDGIKAWSRGDRTQALEYMFDIAQNLTLVASSSGVARALKPAPVVDALVAVRPVKGAKRLWRPDLKPYVYQKQSLAGLEPDAQGIYSASGKQWIKLEDEVFWVKTDAGTRRGVIQHPDDPQAYTPRIKHNGNGAWLHERDDPMQWSRLQLFRRLGPQVQTFSDATAEAVLSATHTTDGMLRKWHMEHLAPAPVLLDCMSRVRLSEMIDSFIAQMKQGIDRSTHNAVLQLELLTRLEGWPPNRVLRVVDAQGATVKEYGQDVASTYPRLQLTHGQVSNGDLLKATLENLSREQIEVLLGVSDASLEQQVQALARKLGDFAQAIRSDLLWRMYSLDEVMTAEMLPLQQQFPGLPVSVMHELLEHLTPAQKTTLQASGRLPLRVLEEARGYAQVLRLNRALEGLYFDALSNADSNTLVWHTVTQLPGWPASLRLVLRDKTTGEVLSSVGNPSAAYHRELFKSVGQYEFYGTDAEGSYSSPSLAACMVRALLPAERLALGISVAEPTAVLSRKVADLAARNRAHSAQALGMQPIKPWFKSPLRLADGRAGYPLGGRSGHVVRESRALLNKDLVADLYPLMTEEQAGLFIARLKLSPELTTRALVKLKAELDTLRHDLELWTDKPVWTLAHNGPRQLVSTRDKRAISRLLIQAWRRQTESMQFGEYSGYVLNLNAWPVDCLPVLSADFGHVSTLHLSQSPNGKFPVNFLEKFAHLRVLSLQNNHLRELPVALASMPELIYLNLQGNQIVLSDRTAHVLSGLTKLKSLNLMGNALGRRFSVRQMTDLEHLNLRYTSLQTWPEGVESLGRLQTLDLRDNAISRIPHEVLSADWRAINRATHLHDNPLSVDSLHRLNSYRREQGIDFGIAPRRQHVAQEHGIFHWSVQPTFEQTGIWNELEDVERSTDFFRVLEDLSASSQYLHGRENLSQRVWQILNAMHASSELRDQLFEVSANPNTCADGIPMIFADLELRHQIFTAHSAPNAEAQLLKLAHGLFRIELLNTHVQGVIDARIAAVQVEQRGHVQLLQDLIDAVSADFAPEPLVNMSPEEQQGVAYRLGTPQALRLAQRLSPADLQARLDRVEPLEVQMFYQVKLAHELGLPARPKNMMFERMANVTEQQLSVAKDYVLNEDTQAAKIAYLEKLSFWEAFLEKKFPERFKAIDSPFHERMQVLYVAREKLSSQQYVSQTEQVSESRRQAREGLISRLTRAEIEEHPFPLEPSSSSSSGS